MSEVVVSSISFTEGMLEVAYMVTPDSMKLVAGRPVVMVSSMMIERDHPEYADQVQRLEELARDLVTDVREDFAAAEIPAADAADDDEDEGMGE